MLHGIRQDWLVRLMWCSRAFQTNSRPGCLSGSWQHSGQRQTRHSDYRAKHDPTDSDWTLTVLHIILGVVFFAHGSQKLLGWFGGPGLKETMHTMHEHLLHNYLRYDQGVRESALATSHKVKRSNHSGRTT